MGESAYALETNDGIRCTWLSWPSNKIIATRNVIPLVILYTPRKEIQGISLVEYEPVFCSRCKCVLNPYTQIDYTSKAWLCTICLNRNTFPLVYKAYITEANLPSELQPLSTTIEYILPHEITTPSIFLFVIDTCLAHDELSSLKSTLLQTLNLLPSESLVGIIRFGKNVLVHNLGWQDGTRVFHFKGDKKYTNQEVKDKLGILNTRGPVDNSKRTVVPIGEYEFLVSSVLENLKRDTWPVQPGNRPMRSTGNAISIAISLLDILHNKQGGRIFVLSGGACTYGPGNIISTDLNEQIRTYHDIKNDAAPYLKNAKDYYDDLAFHAGNSGHAIDLFSCSIDQIGLLEMRSLSEKTGGYMVFSDSFDTDVFKKTLNKLFKREDTGALQMGFNSNVQIFISNDMKLSHVLGPGSSLTRKTNENNKEEGEHQKKMCLSSIDFNTTLAYYLDLAGPELERGRKNEIVQFQCMYQHSSGRLRLRVTTVKFPVADSHNMSQFISGFDQETSAVAVARWAVHKTKAESTRDIIAWLDRTLVRLIKVFAAYQEHKPETFKLCREFSLFPQFLFYLRRSQMLQTFNVSPDESAYYQTILLRENVTNSLLMIQPALLKYSFDSPEPQPVLLDIASLKNDVILLLDTFLIVVVWHGENIANWKKLGYQDKPEYENFAKLLQMPIDDAELILADRFPVPRFIETEHGKGHERVLKAKVNPSSSAENGSYFNEAVSLKTFTDSLMKFVVNP